MQSGDIVCVFIFLSHKITKTLEYTSVMMDKYFFQYLISDKILTVTIEETQ